MRSSCTRARHSRSRGIEMNSLKLLLEVRVSPERYTLAGVD